MEYISTFVADAKARANAGTTGLGKEQLEIIWQMGVASFASTNNQLIIPSFMAVKLSDEDVNDLKTRFSSHFGNVITIAFMDDAAQVFRICKALDTITSNDLATYLNSPSTSDSPESFTSASSSVHAALPAQSGHTSSPRAPAKQLRLPGKKSKVPRPPNAFILYRQKYHPILKASQPNIRNNDISVILGKQWKEETEEVKAHFKATAEKIKEQHAAENPGYQYAPRKPAEKKRRMTARKIARLNAGATDSDVQSNSDHEMMDAPSGYSRDVDEAAVFPQPISATDILDSERDIYPNHIQHHRDADMSLMMPTGHSLVEHDYEIKLGSAYPNPTGFKDKNLRANVGTYRTGHSANANDFMNSLIDWEQFDKDHKVIRETLGVDRDEAIEALGDEAAVAFDDKDEEDNWRTELQNILWMFE
ncbi:hypothetical protein LTR06_001503 [Exophiala xenobiotica]|nr:hypothetical protein LTR06_001503 [Exophiala xenobiotica]